MLERSKQRNIIRHCLLVLNLATPDTPSTSRHQFGELYREDGKTLLKLNLQVRLAKTRQTHGHEKKGG